MVFADSLGLPLTQVKILIEEFSEFGFTSYSPSPLTRVTQPSFRPGLRLNFPQPSANLRFLDSVRQCHVYLERCQVDRFTLNGTVLVHNVCYEKEITVRYSVNNWRTHSDLSASYSCSMLSDIDRFRFALPLSPSLPVGTKIHFCVRARFGTEVFWDNNSNKNYTIELAMLPVSTPAEAEKQISDDPNTNPTSFSTIEQEAQKLSGKPIIEELGTTRKTIVGMDIPLNRLAYYYY